MQITVHGFKFQISGHGWGRHEASKDRGIEKAIAIMRSCSPAKIAAIWATAAMRGRAPEFDGRPNPLIDALTSIEFRAAAASAKGRAASECYIDIEAVQPSP